MTDVGDRVILQAEFTNRAGDLADPTVVAGWIKTPSSVNSSPLTFVRISTGIWEATYDVVEGGKGFKWRVQGTGAITAAEERSFDVDPQEVIPHA